MKIYNVIHQYDVDGGFGDAISKSKLIFTKRAYLTKNTLPSFVGFTGGMLSLG